MKKIMSIIILTVLLTSTFPLVLATPSISGPDVSQFKVPIDGTPIVREVCDQQSLELASQYKFGTQLKANERKFYAKNTRDGSVYQLTASLRATGTYTYIYSENGQNIDDATVEYWLNEFENTIYPKETSSFGNPPDVDNDPRIYILLLDILDNYDPLTNPVFVAGYFWPSQETGYDRIEIIYIDVNPGADRYTLAHEFNHMIHYNYDSDEEIWVDEGLAVYAEYVVYKHHQWSYLDAFFSNPETSLTSWSQDLEHYGASYCFMLYISEKYGGTTTVQKILQDTANGQDGINNHLPSGTTFENVFKTWSIANYLDDTTINTLYGYTSIDMHASAQHKVFSGGRVSFSEYRAVGRYANEYTEITSDIKSFLLSFDGQWLTNYLIRVLKIKGTSIDIETLNLNWLKDGSTKILDSYNKIVLVVSRLDDWFGDGTYTATIQGLFDFYIDITTEKQYYKPGETTKTSVTVTNTGDKKRTFWLGVSFRDATGDVKKYDSQISITPISATLDPGQTASFSVTWTIPTDAPIGPYQISVNCGKDSGFKQSYTDNINWAFIFYVYKLNILIPTSSAPALVGEPTNPNKVLVLVQWIPRWYFVPPTFSIRIDDRNATYELIDTWVQLFGLYTLKVNPPVVPSEGLYNLSITVTFAELTDSDVEENAIKYVAAPPAEPIQKGLAWLRTRQSADGSWRGSVGVTSLAVLAFLNAGYDETDATVSKAMNYILSNVKSDGSIYNSNPTYETSLAILPLVATRNEAYKTVIENAKKWLVNTQWDENCLWGGVSKDSWYYGGWGYGGGQRPDLSNTQFALLALDAAGLPKDDPTWVKAQVFLHRCQNINFPITLNIEGVEYTVQPYNHYGGYDGGFIYHPGASLAGGQTSYGSMTGAGIWGLLLSGVPKTDPRVVAAINWVRNHYTWDGNPGMPTPTSFQYYYYLSMSKALTMYGEQIIDGHDWYREMYDKIVGLQKPDGYWINPDSRAWENIPELVTAYSILSIQTRMIAPPVQRLSYLTFILRSNCFLRIVDPEGNAVGYNYQTGLGENNIPTAIYSGPFMEPQYIIIVNPQAGTYCLELIGISEGPYELTIQGNYGEEVTDTFTYEGEIKPGELHATDVTVTAIVGPIDVYASPPEFQEVIDNIPPTTMLEIGEPKHADLIGNIYVSFITPFTLTAEDNSGGTGVASTIYRIYNNTYDTGWIEYLAPFYLTGLSDGEYSIDYYSIDNMGNVEPINSATVILDNTPPTTTLTIGEPKYVSCIIYVTPDTPLTLEATDAGAGINATNYRIYNSTYDSGWIAYTGPFYLTSLADGTYTIEYYSIDNVQNAETAQAINVTLFSWNYIFEDTYGRGTTLKINLAHKFFQFITPDKDYGIRKATYMRQCGRAIIIHYYDDELRLISTVVDTKLDFCVTMAWDMQTGKRYFLIDKAGKE